MTQAPDGWANGGGLSATAGRSFRALVQTTEHGQVFLLLLAGNERKAIQYQGGGLPESCLVPQSEPGPPRWGRSLRLTRRLEETEALPAADSSDVPRLSP